MTLTDSKNRAAALADRIGHLMQERQIMDDRLWIMREELREITENDC